MITSTIEARRQEENPAAQKISGAEHGKPGVGETVQDRTTTMATSTCDDDCHFCHGPETD